MRYKIFSTLLAVTAILISAAEGANPAESPATSGPADLLKQKDIYLKCYAIHNIAHRRQDLMSLVPACASDTEPIVRRAACFAMALQPHSKFVPVFQKLLKDSDPGVRRYATIGLSGVEGDKHLKLILSSFFDPEPYVREAAAISAGCRRFKPALGHLVKLLGDDSPKVRRAAAISIGRIEDRRALKYLQNLMENIQKGEKTAKAEKLNRRTKARLGYRRNFPIGFSYFPEMIEKFARKAAVPVFLFEELSYELNTAAEDPWNLNNFKLSIWNQVAEKTLERIVKTVNGYWYIDCGTVFIAPGSYKHIDTPLELEVACAMARLGDKSSLGVIKKYVKHPLYGHRAKQIIKNIK